MKRGTLVRVVIGVGLVLALAGGVRAALHQLRPAAHEIPTARVRRGNLELKVYSSGDLRATRSVNLIAPPVLGALQIIHLAPTGSRLKAGDIVVEFDPSEQEYKLEQSRSEVAEAEQQITKSRADAEVSAAQDKVALLKAQFDVRRAELDVSRNELLSAIDAQKNVLALEEARRRLAQLQQDIKSRAVSNRAALAVLEEKRNKSALVVKQAEHAIEIMRLRSPIPGMVVIRDNLDAIGNWAPPGIILPEYREGDVVRSGRVVAEVLQVEDMEIQAKISEADRANVSPGQKVEVQVNALPGVVFRGRVKAVAGLASRDWPDMGQRFDATFTIDHPDPRLRSGQSAQVMVEGDPVRDALFLPRQAIFDKGGKPIVYAKSGGHFQAREIKLTHRTESQVTVEGLNEGDEVALVDPDKAGQESSTTTSVPLGGGGH